MSEPLRLEPALMRQLEVMQCTTTENSHEATRRQLEFSCGPIVAQLYLPLSRVLIPFQRLRVRSSRSGGRL